MTWLSDLLFNPSGFSHGMVVYSFVIALGLTLGRIKIFGVSLGSTWVLFLGLILSWLGLQVNPDLIAFFKNFGLILFVFFIGLQVGPSFFATFRNGGWGLNGLTLFGVLLSLAITIGLFFIFKNDISLAQMMGVHFGAGDEHTWFRRDAGSAARHGEPHGYHSRLRLRLSGRDHCDDSRDPVP